MGKGKWQEEMPTVSSVYCGCYREERERWKDGKTELKDRHPCTDTCELSSSCVKEIKRFPVLPVPNGRMSHATSQLCYHWCRNNWILPQVTMQRPAKFHSIIPEPPTNK